MASYIICPRCKRRYFGGDDGVNLCGICRPRGEGIDYGAVPSSYRGILWMTAEHKRLERGEEPDLHWSAEGFVEPGAEEYDPEEEPEEE